MQNRDLLGLSVGALASGLLAVGVVILVCRGTRTKEAAAIGIVLSTFFGAGVVLLSIVQRNTSGNQAGLDKFLFGETAGGGGRGGPPLNSPPRFFFVGDCDCTLQGISTPLIRRRLRGGAGLADARARPGDDGDARRGDRRRIADCRRDSDGGDDHSAGGGGTILDEPPWPDARGCGDRRRGGRRGRHVSGLAAAQPVVWLAGRRVWREPTQHSARAAPFVDGRRVFLVLRAVRSTGRRGGASAGGVAVAAANFA